MCTSYVKDIRTWCPVVQLCEKMFYSYYIKYPISVVGFVHDNQVFVHDNFSPINMFYAINYTTLSIMFQKNFVLSVFYFA